MTSIDRAILEDFDRWRQSRLTGQPDVSVDAYLLEREAHAHRDRIRRTLEMPEWGLLEADLATAPPEDAKALLDALHAIHGVLTADLEIIEERTVGGAVGIHFA